MPHRSHDQEGSASKGVCIKGGGVCLQGVYIQSRGSTSRGVLHPGGRWTDPPPDIWDTTGFGQQADGTHPTGMHSCCNLSSHWNVFSKESSDAFASVLETSDANRLLDSIEVNTSDVFPPTQFYKENNIVKNQCLCYIQNFSYERAQTPSLFKPY